MLLEIIPEWHSGFISAPDSYLIFQQKKPCRDLRGFDDLKRFRTM